MEQLTKNFNLSEFICHCGCGSDYINRDLVDLLQQVRDHMPMQNTMTVTSGVRCEKHNSQIGGSLTSSHIDGVAVDLKCESGAYRQQLESTPVVKRPYRPFHFYGNTVRRRHYRGTAIPTPRDLITVGLFPVVLANR